MNIANHPARPFLAPCLLALCLVALLAPSACDDDGGGSGDAATPDLGDTSPDDTAGDTTPDTPSDVAEEAETGPVALCDPAHGAVDPIPTGPVTYTEWTVRACLNNPCLCSSQGDVLLEDLLACDAIQEGFFWNFGSVGVRVLGRTADDQCEFEMVSEVEGGAGLSRCTFPLPARPWEGMSATFELENEFLDGFPGTCEQVGSCCIFPGCPDPCGEAEADWPFCPEGATLCPEE